MCLICLQAYLHKCLYNPVLVDILLPNPIEKREKMICSKTFALFFMLPSHHLPEYDKINEHPTYHLRVHSVHIHLFSTLSN